MCNVASSLTPTPPSLRHPYLHPQVLLGLYFFLAGMVVRSQPVLWLLPVVSVGSAMAAHGVHVVSGLLLPFYRLAGGPYGWAKGEGVA